MQTKFIIEARTHAAALVCFAFLLTVAIILWSCGTTPTVQQTNGMATVRVTISDPPSCSGSSGPFAHVFITVRSVQAHIDPAATDSSSGWQELAPQLASAPMQIDLFSQEDTNCVLAELGSAQLPAGSYQQIRLLLVSNSPAAGAAVPKPNACAGNGFNCVQLNDGTNSTNGTIHELLLSSQDNTGLKIPPGQIVGRPLQVGASQSVDLNIDFNACASIIQEGNGQFRLKPTLTAGQISANNSGISGQVVDSVTGKPISGPVIVAIERLDNTGTTDRIMMQATPDANGNFRFCPLPTGTFDIVAVALGPNNLPYNATAVLNVPNGTSLGLLSLVAETGATGPALLKGFVTATAGTAPSTTPATVDVSFTAFQAVTISGGTTRQLSIPLQTTQATATAPSQPSTSPLSVDAATSCPTGAPAHSNCAQYTLVVPGSNPSVGVFSSSGFKFAAPATGDVLFTVDAQTAKPMSGGTAICSPSERTTSKDVNGLPLKVTAGATTNVAELDFISCS